MLAGTPTVRRATTTDVLRPGDVLAFTAGPEWAHRVENRSGEPARVLIVSTMHRPEVAEYPDTGNVLTLTGDPAGAGVELRAFRLADRVDHLEGELGHP